MSVFSDPDVFHRVTGIYSADGVSEGHRDVVLISV
jgi:hypothetical protein